MVRKFFVLFNNEGPLYPGMRKQPIEIKRQTDGCDSLLSSFKNVEESNVFFKPTDYLLQKIALRPKQMKGRDTLLFGRDRKVRAEAFKCVEVQT